MKFRQLYLVEFRIFNFLFNEMTHIVNYKLRPKEWPFPVASWLRSKEYFAFFKCVEHCKFI